MLLSSLNYLRGIAIGFLMKRWLILSRYFVRGLLVD